MPPKPSVSPPEKAEMYRLHTEEGLKQKEIAHLFGVMQWTVSRAIRDERKRRGRSNDN